MIKIFKKIDIFLREIEDYPISFLVWCITFLSIILIRIFIESWIDGFSTNSAAYIFYNIYNTFIFFLFSYLLFLGFLSKFFKLSFKKISKIMLWGYLIVIFPPIIDYIIFGDSPYLNFYGIYELSEMSSRFFTFFGGNPNFGVTYGTRVEIAIIVVFLFLYGYIKTHKLKKSILVAFFSYILLFFLATLPSWLAIVIRGTSKGFLSVGEIDIVQIFMTPTVIFSKEIGNVVNALSIKLSLMYSLFVLVVLIIGLFLNYRDKFLVFLKNIRPVQVIYHLGLLIIGVGLGYRLTVVTWDIIDLFNIISFVNIAVAVLLAWITSVIINDISDEKIDSISNRERPLILRTFSRNEYLIIGVILFIFSILFSALVNPKIAMLLVIYQMLSWIYSMHPFRFKRIPILATFISAVASLLILFSGFILVSPNSDIDQLPINIVWLIIISFTLSLPIKDLKDIDGDKEDGVMTIPVIFGEYWGKVIIGSNIFISYILSMLFLHEYRLLFPAILFGGMSFWIVILSGKNKKITHRNVIRWIMGLVFIYIIILVRYI